MTVNNFIPAVWSAKLFESLNKAHVYAALCNRDYEGEIKAVGDTVKINSIGRVTISPYSKNTSLGTPQFLTDAQATLQIDTANSFNFAVDDIDMVQTKPKVMEGAMRDAAWGLSDAVDVLLAGLHTQTPAANKVGSDASVKVGGSLTAGAALYDLLVDLAVILDSTNTPRTGRWVVVPPWAHGMLTKDNRFINATEQGNQIRADGIVGRAAGFDVWMSNNVTYTGSGSTASWRVMAGYPGTITYAEQIVKTEAYRPEDYFADAVKGLHVCGYKVIRTENLATLYVKSAAS